MEEFAVVPGALHDRADRARGKLLQIRQLELHRLFDQALDGERVVVRMDRLRRVQLADDVERVGRRDQALEIQQGRACVDRLAFGVLARHQARARPIRPTLNPFTFDFRTCHVCVSPVSAESGVQSSIVHPGLRIIYRICDSFYPATVAKLTSMVIQGGKR
jgi:hypothetical protein